MFASSCWLQPLTQAQVFKFGVYLAVPVILTLTFVGVPENMQRVVANVRALATHSSVLVCRNLTRTSFHAARVCCLSARGAASTHG